MGLAQITAKGKPPPRRHRQHGRSTTDRRLPLCGAGLAKHGGLSSIPTPWGLIADRQGAISEDVATPLSAPSRLALAGDGPLALELLTFFVQPRPDLAGLALTGVASSDPEITRRALSANIPAYGDIASLAAASAAQNDLAPATVLICGSEDEAAVRSLFPNATIILGPEAARFVAGLLGSNLLCQACRLDLQGARSLFSAVVDQLREDVLLLNPNGMITDCNSLACERRGLRREEMLGRHFSEVLDPEEDLCHGGATACPFSTTLRTGQTTEATYTRLDDQGRVRYFRVYAFAVRGADAGITHVAELRRDVTQRTEMEQRLRMSQKLAAIGELSTFLAHEIRNPLFAISGFANSLLRMAALPDTAREKVGIILDESRRLDDILKSILNFAKPMEAGAGEVDVAQVARETLPLLTLGCEGQRVEVRLDLPEGLAKARADKDLIKQCLINLIKNSVEAMPNGGVLTVRASMDARHVLLQVQDTGVGIPEDQRELVFSPFFSTKEKGSGLGLAMIKKIIEDLGGEVELASRPGIGTTVTLRLPLALAPSMEPSITPSKGSPQEAGFIGTDREET